MRFPVSLACAAFIAAPAFAGDQPVMVTVMPPIIFKPVPMADTTSVRTITVTGTKASPAAVPADPSTSYRAMPGQSASDELYARVLAEAKARGLR